MKRSRKALLLVAASALATTAAITAQVGSAPPAYAATCSNVFGAWSAYYDYSWVTDANDDCGYMATRHYYYAGTQSQWTTWVGGSLHHYESPRKSEATAGQYTY